MVYFVSCRDISTIPVYPEFLDTSAEGAFDGIRYEQNPELLDLNAVEREFLAKGASAIEHGYRVIGDTAPKKMLWEGGDNPLPDIIQRNCLAISPGFRDLVEQFEPGVHQFFPVEIYKARNSDSSATYYWINVCNRIDSIDPDQSNLYWKSNYAGERGSWRKKDGEDKLVFSLRNISDRHLWMDPFLSTHRYFYCSNQFAQAAKAENFLGLELTEQKEA